MDAVPIAAPILGNHGPHLSVRSVSPCVYTFSSRGAVTERTSISIDTYDLPEYADVCADAKRSLTVDNAGGKSDVSEMYSIDYFARSMDACHTLLEKEITYWIDYKMVDFICTIPDGRVGVSVARAMGYPTEDRFTAATASRLLYKKLHGLIIARNGVSKSQNFYRSFLHIWCQNARIAELLQEAFQSLDDDDYGLGVKGTIVLQLTICADARIYRNIRPI